MTMRGITRWDPFGQFRDEMGRLFDDLAVNWPAALRLGWRPGGSFPALNVWEDEHQVFAEAELPGLKMEDLEISVMGNELTIRGERKDDPRESAVHHRRERGLGAFSRVIRLPVDIDPDRVAAALRNGVLTITLPKAEKAKPRKVEVRPAAK